MAFTNGYHGLSQGSLAVTGNNEYRDESYISRTNATLCLLMVILMIWIHLNILENFRRWK